MLLHLAHRERPTVPTVETLEKTARALEVPSYRLFYDGEAAPKLENLPKRKAADEIAWGSSGKDARFFSNLRRALGRAQERDRKLLLSFVQELASKRNGGSRSQRECEVSPKSLQFKWNIFGQSTELARLGGRV